MNDSLTAPWDVLFRKVTHRCHVQKAQLIINFGHEHDTFCAPKLSVCHDQFLVVLAGRVQTRIDMVYLDGSVDT